MRCSLFVTCALLLVACNKAPDTAPPDTKRPVTAPPAKAASKPAGATSKPAKSAAVSADATAALDLYKKRCVTCHGALGAGDGPAARALNPHPRSFTDKAWQKSITDEQIANVTIKGGKAVGKSNMMPPNPDLAEQPKLTAALVALIRSFER